MGSSGINHVKAHYETLTQTARIEECTTPGDACPLVPESTRPSACKRASTTDSSSTIHMISTSHSPSTALSSLRPVPATTEPTLNHHTKSKPPKTRLAVNPQKRLC